MSAAPQLVDDDRYGALIEMRPLAALPPSVRGRIRVTCEHWLWVGRIVTRASRASEGTYGVVGLRNRTRVAHAHVYELLVGPYPPGWHVDHLCDEQLCCYPQHLEPVRPQENLARARVRERGRRIVRGDLVWSATPTTGVAVSAPWLDDLPTHWEPQCLFNPEPYR